MNLCWAKVDSFPGNRSSAETTDYRRCPICGSDRFRTVLQFDQFQFYSDSNDVPKRVDIREVQCLDCLALCLNPCYTSYGFRVLFAEAGRSYGSTVGHCTEQIDWLKSQGLLRSGQTLLDAGCYDGGFLAKLPEDMARIGVDIDEPAIRRGRDTFGGQGIDLILGDFEDFWCDKTPDVITMFHVLEHLPRPVPVLRHLRSKAHSGTRLVVEVPVLENGQTNDINGFFTVQHTTHFSRVSLENCLRFAGWSITQSHTQPDYNGYRVIASPAEPIERAAKDMRSVSTLREYLSTWNLAVKAVEVQLSGLEDQERCVLWGAGAHTEFLYQTTSLFLSMPDREYLIVDSDPMKQGRTWRGIQVHSPNVLGDVSWKNVNLLISSYGSTRVLVDAARKLGVPLQKVVALYKEFRVY
jgi:2-polyprenyl-3-methyl-5-hydroxy-6-metoxy-1,4-benzoquinol methylase